VGILLRVLVCPQEQADEDGDNEDEDGDNEDEDGDNEDEDLHTVPEEDAKKKREEAATSCPTFPHFSCRR
jgi:hypothetical protein